MVQNENSHHDKAEHQALLEATLPLALRNTGGGLWLRKLG